MKDIIDKISSYNLFNYLLPGILFVVIIDNFMIYSFMQDDIITGVFVYYFIGLVISRFGSLVIEPVLKKINFLKFAEYKDFVVASKKDSKIDIFSEVNNMHRTFCSMFVLLVLLKIYSSAADKIAIPYSWNTYVLLTLLLIMFFYSYRKQTKYITHRIKATLEQG